jgi:hypothetical protein
MLHHHDAADSEAASASWPIALAANLSLRLAESRGADPGQDPQLAVTVASKNGGPTSSCEGGPRAGARPGWHRRPGRPWRVFQRPGARPSSPPRGPCADRSASDVGSLKLGPAALARSSAAGTANLNTLRACMGAWEAHAAQSYRRRRGGMVIVAKQAQRKDRVHAGLSLVVPMYERRIPSELDRAHQTHVHVAARYLLPMLLR